jgi:hypothetical protein
VGSVTVYIAVHEQIVSSSNHTSNINYQVKGVFVSLEAAQVCYPGTWRENKEDEWMMVVDDYNFYKIIRVPSTIPDCRARKMGAQI